MTIDSKELARLSLELHDVERLLTCKGKMNVSVKEKDGADDDPFDFGRYGNISVDIPPGHPMFEAILSLLRERALVLEADVRALLEKGDTE